MREHLQDGRGYHHHHHHLPLSLSTTTSTTSLWAGRGAYWIVQDAVGSSYNQNYHLKGVWVTEWLQWGNLLHMVVCWVSCLCLTPPWPAEVCHWPGIARTVSVEGRPHTSVEVMVQITSCIRFQCVFPQFTMITWKKSLLQWKWMYRKHMLCSHSLYCGGGGMGGKVEVGCSDSGRQWYVFLCSVCDITHG